MTENAIVPLERVERAILVIRGHKVILDTDLAAFYGVTAKRLNEAGQTQHRAVPTGLHVPAHR